MTDLIDRQAAIDKVSGLIEEQRFYDIIGKLESMPSAQQWISVKDRLPSVGEKVLVWYKWSGSNEQWSIAFDKMCITNRFATEPHWVHRNGRITHWMPLPEPPEDEA